MVAQFSQQQLTRASQAMRPSLPPLRFKSVTSSAKRPPLSPPTLPPLSNTLRKLPRFYAKTLCRAKGPRRIRAPTVRFATTILQPCTSTALLRFSNILLQYTNTNGAIELRIHKHTERGDNESIKTAGSGSVQGGGCGCR